MSIARDGTSAASTVTTDDAGTTDAHCLALLTLLAREDGIVIHRATRRLHVTLSELMRVLTVLGNDADAGGLGLVEVRADGERQRLWLTRRGREACGIA